MTLAIVLQWGLMRVPAAAVVFLMGISVEAHAQTAEATEKAGLFQGNVWGMSRTAINKKYPGGTTTTHQNGRITYSVVLDVASRGNASVHFQFPKQGKGLELVSVAFPKPGTSVNFRTGTYTAETTDEAKATFQYLRAILVNQYGDPRDVQPLEAVWHLPAGTVVLSIESGSPSLAMALVSYSSPAGMQRPSGL